MRRILLGALLWIGAASAAFAQCGTTLPAGTVCGNATAAQGLNGPLTQPVLGRNGGTGGSLTLNGATSGSAVIGVNAVAGTTVFNLPVGNGSVGLTLHTDGAGNTSWASTGSGTVSSVGLSLPGIFTVSGSPVTSSGTLTAVLAVESANAVWAGPTTGAASSPSFRALVGADLPNPSASTLGGIQSTVGASHQWISTISTSGVPGLTQPAFSDISGSITPAQCPNPSASTTGCVESFAAVAHQWINTISTSGVPSATQPNFTDIAGNATLAQLPSISNNSVLGNNSGGTAIPSALSASNVLDMIGAVQGDVLYRDASVWKVLAPGTSGQVLSSGGAAANPSWTTVSGTGTVTSIATNAGLTGGTITSSGTIGLATITAGSVMANITGGAAVPIANTPSSILDLIGSATGDILYRSSGSGWQVLAPGTNGQVLTMGASTAAWSNAGTLTNVTIAAGTGIGVSGTCNITTTGTCTVTNSGVLTIAGNTGAFTLGGLLTNATNVLNVTAATKTDQQTATSNVLAVTPLHQQDHPSSPKAWAYFTQSGGTYTLAAAYGVSGFTKTSTGLINVTLSTPFTSTNFAAIAMINAGASTASEVLGSRTASNVRIELLNSSFSVIDANFSVMFFGTQ